MTERRSRSKLASLASIAIACGAALFASTQSWVSLSFVPGSATVPSIEVRGSDLYASLTLIALTGVAALLVLAIAGRVFRAVIGSLTVLLGVGLAFLGTTAVTSPRSAAASAVSDVTGLSGDAQFTVVSEVATTAWPIVAVGSGILMTLAGVTVLVFGRRWRAAGRKYETTGARRQQTRGSGPSDRISDWDALSDGADPTEERDAPDRSAEDPETR